MTFNYRSNWISAFVLLGCIIICFVTISSCEYPTDFERDVFKDPANELYAKGPENISAAIYQNSDLEYKGRIIQIDWTDDSDTKLKSSLWRKDRNGPFKVILEADLNRINYTYFDTVKASQTYTYKVVTDYEGDFQKQAVSSTVETFDWVLLPARENISGYLFETSEGEILSISQNGMEVYNAGQNRWRMIGDVPCPIFVSIPIEMSNSDIFLLCADADYIIKAFILNSQSLVWDEVGRMQRSLTDYSFMEDEYIKPVEVNNQSMMLFGFKRNTHSSDEIRAESLDLKTGNSIIIDRSPMTNDHYQVVKGIAYGVQLNDNEVFVDYQFNALNAFIINLDTYQWNRTQQNYQCAHVRDIKKIEDNRLIMLCSTVWYGETFHTIYDHNVRGWTELVYADNETDFKIHETKDGKYFLIKWSIFEYIGESEPWVEHLLTRPPNFILFDSAKSGYLLKDDILIHRPYQRTKPEFRGVALLNIGELGLF